MIKIKDIARGILRSRKSRTVYGPSIAIFPLTDRVESAFYRWINNPELNAVKEYVNSHPITEELDLRDYTTGMKEELKIDGDDLGSWVRELNGIENRGTKKHYYYV